ncbi:hypothetical protein [Legionella feeleii]|uniref:Uncharacterized protein n=1 Tax=Legionella feeleii TaxID=453 RepID=A0A378IV56_9GAMM|nr:hypothetical protein [Legionella feeleii]STX39029.1 Uncharacterised protein [Legionella feeleii]
MGFFIKNIVVIGDMGGKNGEYHSSLGPMLGQRPIIFNDGTVDNQRVDRMVEQIKTLAECAKNNSKSTRLTRLTTDEFSFYTKNTPLSIEEYKELIDRTFDVLKDLPPNIVLILSSIPVLWPDGTLRNAILHAQSPNTQDSEPIIHHFSKESCSGIDPWYSKDNTPENCYEFRGDDYSSDEYSPDVVLKDTKVKCNDPNQNRSAIIVQGLDLPPIVDAIDVCLDHQNGVAMKNAEQLLRKLSSPPIYISHIVTSNFIGIRGEHLTSSVVHTDHKQKQVEGSHEKRTEKLSTTFGTESTAFIYQSKKAEPVHSKLFNTISNKVNLQDISDNEGNTLLHQILIPDKRNNPYCTHRKRRLESFLPHFDHQSINRQNREGDTPLHLAVKTIDEEHLLLQFLERGARLDIRNSQGLTPIGIAYQHQDQGNGSRLVTALCNKISNNRKIYRFHRAVILELIDEIKDEALKKKLARAALSFENSEPFLTRETLDHLVEISGNSLESTQNDPPLPSVLGAAKEENSAIPDFPDSPESIEQEHRFPELTKTEAYNLIRTELNKGREANLGLIEHIVLQGINLNKESGLGNLSLGASLLIQAFIRRDSISPVTLDFFFTLAQPHLNEHTIQEMSDYLQDSTSSDWIYQELVRDQFNKVLQGKTLDRAIIFTAFSKGKNIWNANYGSLTLAEQAVFESYRSRDPKLLERVMALCENLSIDEIAKKMGETSSDFVDWANAYLEKSRLRHRLQEEFLKGPSAKLDTVREILESGINLDKDGGLHGLTLGEYLIAQAYISRDSISPDTLAFFFNSAGAKLTAEKIKKIAAIFENAQETSGWIYQQWMTMELNKGVQGQAVNGKVIFDTMSQEKEIWSRSYIPPVLIEEPPSDTATATATGVKIPTVSQKPGGEPPLTLAEQAVAQAFKEKNFKMLEKIFIELHKNNLLLDVQKIVDSFDEQWQELARDWIKSQLPQLEVQQILRSEFQKKEQANLELVLENLSKNPDLNQDGGLSNGLNLAEQAIVQAYISQDSKLFSEIFSRYPMDQKIINKMASTLINLEGTFLDNSETMKAFKEWVDQQKSLINQLGDNQAGASQPGGNQLVDNQPEGNQPEGNQPGGNQPGGNQPGGNQPGGNQPGGNQPEDNQPEDNQPEDNPIRTVARRYEFFQENKPSTKVVATPEIKKNIS